MSIGGSDSTFLPTLGEFVDFVRDYRFEGQFDQVARHRAGQLIAEGHATKLLNLRSTLLTLAGGDPMAPAAISKLLSMRTGQGYAEFAVSSFGTDAVIGDTERLPGKWGEYLLASRATTIYGARRRSSSTSSPSGCWAYPRPVSTRASSYSLRSSRLRTLPVGLRGSSSRKITSRGTL